MSMLKTHRKWFKSNFILMIYNIHLTFYLTVNKIFSKQKGAMKKKPLK